MANKHKKLVTERERCLKLMTNEMSEFKKLMIKTIYQAADYDELAYADARDPDTGEIVPLLVGLEPKENDEVSVYPLARIFVGEIPNFELPDGRGNYISAKSVGISPTSEEEGGETERLDKEATAH